MHHEQPLARTLALVLFFAGAMGATSAPAAQNDELFGDLWTSGISGHGTATIDGVMTVNEWRNAASIELMVNVPGGRTPATPYVMNDNQNLYVALKFKRGALDPGNTLTIELDANRSGILDVGDDVFLFAPGGGFSDNYRYPCGAAWG